MSDSETSGTGGGTGEGMDAAQPNEPVDARKRRLLKRLGTAAYATPVTLAMMTMSANACSVSC